MPRPLIPHRATAVLDSAEELISTRGYDGTSVADIAERAGVAKGAVYREFPSKESVLEALLARSTRRLVADVREQVEHRPDEMGLGAAYSRGIRALRREPLLLAFLDGTGDVLGSYVRGRNDDRYALRATWVADFLGELQDAGAIRADLDPHAVAIALSAVTLGFLSIGSVVGGLTEGQLDDALDVTVDLVERGIDETSELRDRQQAHEAQLRLLDRVEAQMQKPEDAP